MVSKTYKLGKGGGELWIYSLLMEAVSIGELGPISAISHLPLLQSIGYIIVRCRVGDNKHFI